jgi:hypothetical protein
MTAKPIKSVGLACSLAIAVWFSGNGIGVRASQPRLPEPPTANPPKQPRTLRVLFIGNSYTYFNNLPALLKGLAASDKDWPQIETEMIVRSGATLQRHYSEGQAGVSITEGKWDFVILQEQSMLPINDMGTMYHYASRLHDHIKKNGAKTVLFSTWARQDERYKQKNVDFAYKYTATHLGAILAPVGLAWTAVLEKDPQMLLYTTDKSHPNAAGSYLAACVIYSTLVGRGTEGMTCRISGNPISYSGAVSTDKVDLVNLSDRECRLLQRISWQTVKTIRESEKPPFEQPRTWRELSDK